MIVSCFYFPFFVRAVFCFCFVFRCFVVASLFCFFVAEDLRCFVLVLLFTRSVLFIRQCWIVVVVERVPLCVSLVRFFVSCF